MHPIFTNRKLIIAIIGLMVFLLLLLMIITFFASSRTSSDQEGPNVTPIGLSGRDSGDGTDQQNITPTPELPGFIQPSLPPSEITKRTNKVKEVSKIISADKIGRLNDFKNKLPQKSDDFDIEYSDVSDTYYYQLKKPDSEQKFDQLIRDNNIEDIKTEFPYLFIKTDKPTDQTIQEEEEKYNDQKSQSRQEIQRTSDKQIEDFEKSQQGLQSTPGVGDGSSGGAAEDIKPLTDLLKILMEFNFEADSSTGTTPTSDNISGGGALDQIFNEAGGKTGTPPKVLRSIMSIECKPILSLPDAKITEYSQPGNGIPPNHMCYYTANNYGGAFGPMQFIKSTWSTYGSAVSRLGGYTHNPNIQNIRDSVFAAGEKLRKDSKSADPNKWTKEEVYRAAGRYYGKCVDKQGLDYCAKAWSEYTSQ